MYTLCVRVKRNGRGPRRTDRWLPRRSESRHLDLWSSIFQAIWPRPPIISAVGRSRVFLPSVYFLNGRNNKRSSNRCCTARRCPAAYRYLQGERRRKKCYARGKPSARVHTRVLRDNAAREVPYRAISRDTLCSPVTVRFRPMMIGRSLRGRHQSLGEHEECDSAPCTIFFWP